MVIHSSQDIAKALGASLERGGLILAEEDLCAEFFDLRTRLAGEVFQKFSNYRARLALVVPNPGAHGERFAELAFEHRTHPHVRIFASAHEAKGWLDATRPR
jgi:hypothetical protein